MILRSYINLIDVHVINIIKLPLIVFFHGKNKCDETTSPQPDRYLKLCANAI